ncbi:hypothetical protein H9Q69_009999 [Fusarium xylarioides]|nr:hypothetical protein H9Q69_009999 [Fusarium xylarioides]
MASQEVGLDSLGPKDQEVAETHHTADYSIVHPETRTDIASFDSQYQRYRPKQLRVINSFDVPDISRFKISAELASKYLSFASKADFISYANNVLPGIVGPAIDVLASDKRVEKIREYDGTSFAWGADGGSEELNEHLSELESMHLYISAFRDDDRVQTPVDLMYFYMRHFEVACWLDTFATLVTKPKLLPSVRKGFIGIRAGLRIEIFILAHAVQILLFAPLQEREDMSYTSTDSYPRRFPLGYPEPGPDDVKVCGKFSLDDLYRALLLMFFLLQQQPGKGADAHISQSSEVWLGYTTARSYYPWHGALDPPSVERFAFQKLPREIQLRIIELATLHKVTPTIQEEHDGRIRAFRKIRCTSEDSLLALKLTSRGMYHLVKTANSVEAISRNFGLPARTLNFRMNVEVDTLRILDMYQGIPVFYDKRGVRAPLPVRKLLFIEARHNRYHAEDALESFSNDSQHCAPGLPLDRLPKLEEYSLILPAEKQSWTMDGLPRIRPQGNNETPAHIGTKWQFNFYRYHRATELNNGVSEGCSMGVPPNFCDDSHLDGNDPSDRPGSIPYIGKYGYERSHGIVGGLWAGFKYFQESKEAYFAPLSWTEVEPLVMGPYRENGTRALFDDHTLQFVSKVWIIRQGTTAPKGWIKVQDADSSDPPWRHQLLRTWNAVRFTLIRIQDSGWLCRYALHQR